MTIEKIVINYLSDALSVPVYIQRPESNPNPGLLSFVVVDHTGGSRSNMLRHAMLALQAYAPTNEEAAELMEEVMSAMDDIIELDEISGIYLNAGPYRFTLTSSKQPRYQAVYELTHYELEGE